MTEHDDGDNGLFRIGQRYAHKCLFFFSMQNLGCELVLESDLVIDGSRSDKTKISKTVETIV